MQFWWRAPHCFLPRGWRVHLQDWPSPLLLALCASEDIRRQEKNLLYPRICGAVIHSASRLWPSQPRMLVTPEGISFLKVKVLLSRFRKWFWSSRILQLIWFSDSKVSWDVLMGQVLLNCTWSLRRCLWCKETRDQLDSGPDHAAWPASSPLYTRFQESPAGEMLLKFYISQESPIPQCLAFPTSQPPPSVWLQGRGSLWIRSLLGLACTVKGICRVALGSRPPDQLKGNRKDFWVLVNLLQIQVRKSVWPER